jgi:uncharacterized protein YcbK (DUF882 family)
LLRFASSEKLLALTMSPRGLSVLAFAGLLVAAGLVLALVPRAAPAAQQAPLAAPRATETARGVAAVLVVAPHLASRFELLSALHVENQTTREGRDLKLYDAHGQIDEAQARALDELLCDARDPKHHEITRIDRRTLQLLFKAAYHFASYEVEVVSAYRKPGRHREGPHGTGAAIDFRLRGISARLLASYLREIPRTGVGVYTHPKTQYVHLDSREHSFHWVDASPPRRHWREKSIGAAGLIERDRRYAPLADLPEGLSMAIPTTADAP